MSHSENKPKTTQTSSTNVTNLNIQDTEGVTLAQSDGNTITVTDHGAIRAAGDVAIESLRSAEESGRGARELIDRTVDDAFAFGQDAFYFGSEALSSTVEALDRAGERGADLTRDSLDFGGGVLRGAVDFARGIYQDSLDTVTGVLAEGQAQLGTTVENINAIARQQSTSSDERVQDIAQKALIAGAVMVGLIVFSARARA